MKELGEQEALERLRSRIKYCFNISDLAREFGVSRAFMSQVLKGKAKMNKAMLESVGIERQTVYRSKHSAGLKSPQGDTATAE